MILLMFSFILVYSLVVIEVLVDGFIFIFICLELFEEV